MLKKVLSLALALLISLSLAACGGNPGSQGESAGSDGQSTPDAGPIVVGHYSYLTGPTSLLGQNITNGVQVAVDKVNEEGGINGRLIELVTYDEKGSQETAKQVVTKLVEVDKVCAIIAPASSPDLKATMSITEEAGIIQIGSGVSASLTNIGAEYTFRSSVNSQYMNSTLVDAMIKMGVKTFGALVVNSEYGESGMAVVEESAKNSNGAITMVAKEYYNSTDVDYSAQIAKLIAADPDAILLYSNTNEAAIAIGQIKSKGYDGYLLGTEGCASSEIRNVAGAAAEGLTFVSPYVIPDEIDEAVNDVEKDFLTRYVEKFGEMVISDTAYRAYDGACLLFEAMKHCENPSDPQQIRDAFVQINGFEGIGGTFNFTDLSGDGLFEARGFAVHNGKNILLEDYLAEIG